MRREKEEEESGKWCEGVKRSVSLICDSIYMELNVILCIYGYKAKALFKGWFSKC